MSERELPIIDLARDPGHIAEAVGAACRGIGFFYIVNHGMPAELMSAAFDRSAAYFGLDLAEKRALAMETVGGNRGYSGLRHEALDPSQGADAKEAFNIGFDLAADDPEIGKPFRRSNVWPAVPEFRATMLGYYDACAKISVGLHEAFARDLGLKPDFFKDKFSKPMSTLRMLRYPAAAGEIGAGEHTDYGNLTLLATDGVGGLEVRTRSGEWIAAPPMAGAFIVNIGDCLMRWTNDVYVSTPHRVVNRAQCARFSIAFFCDPDPDARVEGVPSCGPPRYSPILAADYLAGRLAASQPKRA